jgi:hypothetical protein
MARKFTHKKDCVDDIDLEFNLHQYQKDDISNLLQALMEKYTDHSSEYSSGLVDGLNHAYKIINGTSDDYLSDIKEK